MQSIDLNLLPSLQVLLSEESVTRAAARLHLSVPATSRVLERCRQTFGDELLVRSGRRLTITPRGAELLVELEPVLAQLTRVLGPAPQFDPATLRATFIVRANEVIIATLGAAVLERLAAEAPQVELRFVQESGDDVDALRSGDAHVAIGSYGEASTELRRRPLLRETLLGVLRDGHPAASRRRMTLDRFARLDHVVVSRRGIARGPIDDALAAAGRTRRVAAVVPSFAAALAMCVRSDLTTIAPRHLTELFAAAGGLVTYLTPMPLPLVDVEVLWHARNDNDPPLRWFVDRIAAAAEES